LREAITAANGDAGAETINFILLPGDPGYDPAADLYTLTLAGALPDLSTDISIIGPGAVYVKISGNNTTRVFNVSSGAIVNISGLTISGGNSGNDGGGGIQNNGTLTLNANSISGNIAGGIGGGGIYNGVGAIVNITKCTISGNDAGNGNGGGIAGVGTISVTNSTVTGNSASFGGGIITFSSVTATLAVTSSTISNNSSVNNGGGIAHQHSTPAILRNTIVADNTAGATRPDLSGTFNSGGYNLIGNGSGATVTPTTGDQIGTAAVPISPRLGPLQYNDGVLQTRALLAGSPAIDKGKSFGLTTDQRDSLRPVDLDDAVYPDASDASDIGAFEAQTAPTNGDAPSFIVTRFADTNDGACDADCSLREAITAANGDAGADFITFDIAGAGPHTIQLTAALPALSQSVKILNASGESVTVRRDTGGSYRIFTISDGQNVQISGLTITNGNSTDAGGGINNGNGANLTITDSTVSSNTTSGFGGGGIYNGVGAILHVTGSTVSGNLATGNGNGGGIAGVGTISVTNSTVSDNNAHYAGGGIITFQNTTLTVASSTVANNSAQNFGGGILEQSGGTIIRNAIVANNTDTQGRPDVGGTFNSQGFNLIKNISGATINETQNAGTNIIGQDPNLGALQNNGGTTATRALLPGSPAIDKGRSFGLTTDQRGSLRPVDVAGITNAADGADIGAFELSSAPEIGKEGDIAARPSGDGQYLSDDLIQLRRFLNGADAPDSVAANEFQRADSAPYATRGDGALCSSDLIQIRRFINGADSSQLAGGPTTQTGSCGAFQPSMVEAARREQSKSVAEEDVNRAGEGQVPGVTRALRVESPSPTSAGQTVTVNIRVDALGDESAYSFRLNYNQAVLINPVFNSGTTGASIIDCDASVTNRIGCTIEAFPNNQPGSNSTSIKEIGSGDNQRLLSITFTVAAGAAVQTVPLTLSNVSTSNDQAQNLAITPTNGTVTVSRPTAATVTVSGRVMATSGRGIRGARLTLNDSQGNVRTAISTAFGYYLFDNVEVGATYIISVSSKRYTFTPSSQVLNINEQTDQVNFIADSEKWLRNL
jgi:CSLREA domain-containing protein